ncbi:MAG: hypothetical protein IJO33_01495 [Bacilli bacterium]|nr:hypothetical protein [Bacilli bacterium]
MKKFIYTIIIATILFVPIITMATPRTLTPCDAPIIDESGRKVKTCYLDLEISGTDTFQTVTGSLKLTNTSFKSEPEVTDSRIKMIRNGDSYVFTTTTPIKNETIRLTKFTLYFATNGKECRADWIPNDYNVYYCENKNGYFYDLNGNIVNEIEYNKQCKTHSCEIIDGTYYDKNNNVVSKEEYEKQCTTPSCKIIDGIYYDKSGKAVTEVEYDKQCNVHYCKILDGTYFGSNGNIVSKAVWESECQVASPDTGGFFSIWTALIGSTLVIMISIILKKINKVKKI